MNQFETLIKIYDFIRPVLDIGIITFLLYKAYQLITKTNAIQLIRAAVVVVLSYAVAVILQLRTLLWIFSVIAPGLMMAFAIVFQPELRKVFLKLGQAEWSLSEAEQSILMWILFLLPLKCFQSRSAECLLFLCGAQNLIIFFPQEQDLMQTFLQVCL